MIEQFSTDAEVLLVEGTPRQRFDQYTEFASRGDYLLINYHQLVGDWEFVSKLDRSIVIADEVTAIKNFTAKRSKRLKRLDAPHKWGLTGQPIENRAEEVFSIMQWVDPEVLGDGKVFDQTFVSRDHWGRVRAYKNLPTLHRTLSEAMVRATRSEVADQLPAVVEESILVEFDAAGARLYRHITRELLADLEEALGMGASFDPTGFYSGDNESVRAIQGQIMSKMTCMRMMCDHPDLLRISARYFSDRTHRVRSGSGYAYLLDSQGLLDGVQGAPKLEATIDLLGDILEADTRNKTVLFSGFKDALKIIATETASMTRSVFFTGDQNTAERDAAVQQFTTDPKTRLFLSSDAGGMGLDLPMANFLISYDLPWSAGAWAQRQSRIIRLSTTFPKVTLISMLMSGSIEERQYDQLAQKQRIADAVIDGRGYNAKGRLNLDLMSLARFLQERQV
jgi:SNF2 family DNA or RNA helicase